MFRKWRCSGSLRTWFFDKLINLAFTHVWQPNNGLFFITWFSSYCHRQEMELIGQTHWHGTIFTIIGGHIGEWVVDPPWKKKNPPWGTFGTNHGVKKRELKHLLAEKKSAPEKAIFDNFAWKHLKFFSTSGVILYFAVVKIFCNIKKIMLSLKHVKRHLRNQPWDEKKETLSFLTDFGRQINLYLIMLFLVIFS